MNGIAPALMLRSNGQSETNFEAMHAANPLGRGVEPEHLAVRDPLFYMRPAVTGEILTIDGGQRFEPPARDVQFLERR